MISGRPAEVLRERLYPEASGSPMGTPSGVLIYGLYGLEWIDEGGDVARPEEALRWSGPLEHLASSAEVGTPAGVRVERKGLGVTLHWRLATDPGAARQWAERLVERLATPSGLSAQEGRMSLEVRAPLRADKGTVLEALCKDAGWGAFLGDDVGDLPAFEALSRLRAAGTKTVAVAVRSEESPPSLLAQADVIVEGPAGATALLEQLLALTT